MTSIIFKRLQMLVPATAVLAIVIGSPRPARASDCTGELGACYERAASAGSIWDVWAAGYDCEVDFTGCVRGVLFEA